MSESQWSRADRAAAALQAHGDKVHGPCWDGYGDEGSDEFLGAVQDLLVDLKHLLWRVDPTLELVILAEDAVNTWASECDTLPEGGDDDA